jgi:hypothetical protein
MHKKSNQTHGSDYWCGFGSCGFFPDVRAKDQSQIGHHSKMCPSLNSTIAY